MKTLHLPQNTFNNASGKAAEFYERLPKTIANFNVNNKLAVRKAKTYIVDALNEGLKQNLLGTDINMEFLILSIRSYSGLLYNMVTYRNNTKNN